MSRVNIYDDVSEVAEEVAKNMFSGNFTVAVNFLIKQGALSLKLAEYQEIQENRGDDK
jgi:hypothetical protein